jgi:glycosyltransferase involved in cell wall biosynthesis
MSQPLISVVIPVYNAADYLEQCIYSVLNQSLKEIEVIAVNDGSIDRSGEILDDIAANDSRLRVLHHVNKGVSAARNYALQKANGVWVAFCDADDYYEPNMLEILFTQVQFHNSDWAICNVNSINSDGIKQLRLQKLANSLLEVGEKRALFIEGLMRFHYDNANWNKLYKNSIIQENKIIFSQKMSIWEDLLFNLKYLHFVKKVVLISNPLYNYRILNTGLYSGLKIDLIHQVNLLYLAYNDFAIRESAVDEAIVFQHEISRIAYNEILPYIENRVKSKSNGFFHFVAAYHHELKRLNPEIFNTSHSEIFSIKGIKKKLLRAQAFRLIAIIVAYKAYLSQPYKLKKAINNYC